MVSKRKAILTVDLEDYRRQQLRDVLGCEAAAHPDEVAKQLGMLLELFERCSARATFLTVGRLTKELPSSTWQAILARHHIGVHSYEHEYIRALGPARFAHDLTAARKALEDVTGQAMRSFRAPYFSNDGCDPWFGEILADQGFEIDSSVRLSNLTEHSHTLVGSAGRVKELPLCCIGIGQKRLTVIGGTYFRLLPIRLIEKLLERAEALGFIPVVYLHPYDLDFTADPLDFGGGGGWRDRAGDLMRRTGRQTVNSKLRRLAEQYDFCSLETTLDQKTSNLQKSMNS